MHLEALRDTTVRWAGGERHFAASERMHTENSYKWRIEDFAALLEAAGFRAPAALVRCAWLVCGVRRAC